MDNHPPARRPHKSPAHTVKDPGSGLSAFPLPHPATPKCPRESTTIQSISIPSTPCRSSFLAPRCSVQASRPSLPAGRASYSKLRFRQPAKTAFLRVPTAINRFTSAGRALCTCTTEFGSLFFYFLESFFVDLCDDKTNTRKRALSDREHALEAGCEHPLGVFDHLAINAHRTLLELAVGFGIAWCQARRRQ